MVFDDFHDFDDFDDRHMDLSLSGCELVVLLERGTRGGETRRETGEVALVPPSSQWKHDG